MNYFMHFLSCRYHTAKSFCKGLQRFHFLSNLDFIFLSLPLTFPAFLTLLFIHVSFLPLFPSLTHPSGFCPSHMFFSLVLSVFPSVSCYHPLTHSICNSSDKPPCCTCPCQIITPVSAYTGSFSADTLHKITPLMLLLHSAILHSLP